MCVYKTLFWVFLVLAIFLFGMTCAVVGYEYNDLKWAGIYLGWSASPNTAFVYAIPGLIGVVVCAAFAWFFHKKIKSRVGAIL